MRKFLSAVLLLGASVCAMGQGATVLFPPLQGPNGTNIAFGHLTFCTSPATFDSLGNCLTTITVFKDQALTQPYSSGILTDGLGNFPPNQVTTTALWFAPISNACYTATGSNIFNPVSFCTPFTVGFAPGTPLSITKMSRDCRQDGMTANGVADDHTALLNCWNNAIAAGQGTINLPCGTIENLSGLNFTNAPSMTIHGCGSQRCRFTGSCGTNYTTLPNTTVLDCRTGSALCMDFTGSGSVQLDNFTVNTCAAGNTCSSALAGASTTGLLFGRDLAGGGTPYFDFSQWVTLINMQFQFAHDATAHSNFGSIPIYNFGAEQFSIVNSSVYGDTPIWFTLTNATLGVTSAFQTLAVPASMNSISLRSSDFWYTSSTGAGLVAEGSVGTVQIDNSVSIHTSPIASALTSPAILFLGAGTNYNWRIGGQFENQTSSGSNGAIINTNHSLDHFDIDIDVAAYSGSGSPAGLIQWNGQTGLTLSNSVVRMRNINGTAVPLVQNTANTISGTLLDLSSTLNPASFSSVTLADDDIWATGFTDANISFAAGAKYVLHDDTGVSMASGKTTQLFNRIRCTQGTLLVPGDIALGGNWGVSPSVALGTGSTDCAASITVTTGTGSPGANPTVSFTFKDGSWTNTPVCLSARADTNAPQNIQFTPDTVSATSFAGTFNGTPVASISYALKIICMGK